MNILQVQKAQLEVMAKGDRATAQQLHERFGERRDRLTGMPVVNYSSGTSHVPELFPLPDGTTVAAPAMPSAPFNLSELRSHFIDQCCLAFGVPRYILAGTDSRVGSSAAVSIADSTMRYTIDTYRDQLTSVVTDAYRVLQEDTSEDLRVVFPGMIDIPFMRQLYQEGVLTRAAYLESLGKFLNLPSTSFEGEAPAPERGPGRAAAAVQDAPPYKREFT